MSDQDPVEAFASWLNEKRDVLQKLLDDGSWYVGGYLHGLLAEAQCEAIGLGRLDVYEAIGSPPPFVDSTSDFDFMRRQHVFTLAKFNAALKILNPAGEETYGHGELARQMGISVNKLTEWVKKAGVEPPGKKGTRYSRSDRDTILRYYAQYGGRKSIKDNCRRLLGSTLPE